MSERPRKRRGPLLWLADRSRRFWIVAALVLPASYVGSFGPACWINQRTREGGRALGLIYLPIGATYLFTNRWEPIGDYASFGAADNMILATWSHDGPVWVESPPPWLRDSIEDIEHSSPDKPELSDP